MAKSRIAVEVDKMFGYWKVVEVRDNQKKYPHAVCLCTGCDKTIRSIIYSRLAASNSCGCKKGEKAKQTFVSKYGVSNISQLSSIKEKKKQTCLNNCGVEFPAQSDSIKEQTRQVNLKKYGTEHYKQTEESKERYKNTCLEKYGVESVLLRPETIKNTQQKRREQQETIQEKKKNTTQERYGAPYYTQLEESKKKIRQSNLERYGFVSTAQVPEFKKKRECTLLSKYNTLSPSSLPEIKNKIKETTIKRYGVENMSQLPEVKEKKKRQALEKYGVESYSKTAECKEKVKQTCLARFGANSYSESAQFRERIKKDERVIILSSGEALVDKCRRQDVPLSTGRSIYRVYGEEVFEEACLNHKSNITGLESAFIRILKQTFPDISKYNKKPQEFNLNRRPDFRLSFGDKVLYVNVDGLGVHKDDGQRHLEKNYHRLLCKSFEENNQTIFQFRADEIQTKKQIVKSMVLNHLGIHQAKYNARSTTIKTISASEANKFFEVNHLMGGSRSMTSYGLFYKDSLIACMGVRFKSTEELEIVRFASLINSSVRGGFSKFISFIKKQYKDVKRISTFLDKRYSTGISYKKAGFKLESTTLGWKWTDGLYTFNRRRCRANMDNRRLSEKEHAQELKWSRIYDAGQAKYILILKEEE